MHCILALVPLRRKHLLQGQEHVDCTFHATPSSHFQLFHSHQVRCLPFNPYQVTILTCIILQVSWTYLSWFLEPSDQDLLCFLTSHKPRSSSKLMRGSSTRMLQYYSYILSAAASGSWSTSLLSFPFFGLKITQNGINQKGRTSVHGAGHRPPPLNCSNMGTMVNKLSQFHFGSHMYEDFVVPVC